MKKPTARQLEMLRDIDNDCEPTDFAYFHDRAGTLGWANRERVLTALIRRGLLDSDLRLTEEGRETLRREQ